MLPKIVVTSMYEKEALLSSLGLSVTTTMSYEGTEGKIDDLRHFINFGTNISAGSEKMSLVIWDADKLSPECQAVLLKPLESATESMCIYLVAGNENGLLPTILSRCIVVNHLGLEAADTSSWKSVLECFAKGPSKCLALADELEKSEMEVTLEEVIVRLRSALEVSVSKNRLKVLKLAMDCLAKIRYTNVNAKLAMGNFLISAWRLVKT